MMTLDNTTVSNNIATDQVTPAPTVDFAFGGGIETTDVATLTLHGSTVSGNSATVTSGDSAFIFAGAGGINSDGLVNMDGSTIAGNTVSVYANLNYARPAFFAYEVMMVVEHLAGTFDLMVYDPQTERSMPADGCAEALTQSWSRGNEATVALVRDTGTILPVLDRQRARSVDGRLNLFNSRYMLRLLRRYSCRMMKRDERKALRRGSRMAT
jgi:hypothetical protein